MNDQKTTSTQNKLFNSLNKLCLKYRFFIISSNILKISSLGIILISFFLFVSLFIPTLETFTVIITIFITSVSVVILLLITIPKILTNKVINTIDRLLKGEHRFITAWELRNTKQKAKMEALGIHFLEYIPNNTFFVSISDNISKNKAR